MATVTPNREGRGTRVLIWVPIVSALIIDAAYVAIIATQGSRPPDIFTVPFVAGYIALTAVLLALSLIDAPLMIKLRPALRGAAGGGLLVIGILALFSIGLPLVIAGAMATAAAVLTVARSPQPAVIISAVLAAVVAAGVLVAGLDVTARWIVCPASESMGGSGGGILIGGGFTYECNGGRLTIKST